MRTVDAENASPKGLWVRVSFQVKRRKVSLKRHKENIKFWKESRGENPPSRCAARPWHQLETAPDVATVAVGEVSRCEPSCM